MGILFQRRHLGDCLLLIKNGANIKQDKGTGGIPITRIETLSGGVFNRDRLGYAGIDQPGKYESFILESGDLLFSHINSKAYIGRTVLYQKEGSEVIIHGMNLLRIKVIPELLIPKYLYYTTLTEGFKSQVASSRKDAVNQSSISVSDIKRIIIPVPSLIEQQRIVDELDLLTGIIEKKNAQLRDLDALAQSIFYEMFGNPVTNDKGWPKKRIGELVHLYNGRAFKPSDWTDSGLPIVRIQNLNSPDSPYNCYDGVVDEAYLLKGGELLYAWSGTPGTSFGAHIWKGEKAVLNQHIFKVLFDEKYLNKLYFLYQLNLSVSSLFDQTHGGVGLKHITKGTLENQLVPLPNMELQNSFAQKVLAIDSEMDRLKCSLLQTKTLLESRMSEYFNTK